MKGILFSIKRIGDVFKRHSVLFRKTVNSLVVKYIPIFFVIFDKAIVPARVKSTNLLVTLSKSLNNSLFINHFYRDRWKLKWEGPPALPVLHRQQHNTSTGNTIIPMNTLLLTKLINLIQSLGRFQTEPEFGWNGFMRKSPLWVESHSRVGNSTLSTRSGKRISGILSLMMVFLLSFSTAWSQVDLSLSKKISNGNPTVGQTVTYTLTVKNTGTLPATGVVVKDSLPVGGVNFTGSTVVRGTGSFNNTTKLWNVGNIAAGDSAILDIQATVLAQGVFYNIAEVVQMNEQDADSWPNDGALDQDDLASTCFSVPIDWYEGDEFLVSVPSGYKGIVWFYNGTPISDSTVVAGKTVAVVNQDSSLTIKGIGSFSFTSTVGVACPASGCCAIQIVQGPIYDLALNKSLAPGQSSNVNPGSLVTFRISVTNEGNVPATQIAITDSLPAALSIQDPNWTQSGNIATLVTPLAGPLAPGATIFTDIIVRVNNSFTTGTLTNYAQIQNVRDGQGGAFPDRDSSPGNGFNNGEDDRDSEAVQVSPTPVFDLALNKSLAPGQSANVNPGSTVKYRITITNQGNVPATQIAITDSLPSGLVLQDAAWTATGNIATLNVPIAGPLAPSATAFVDITTQVSNSFTGSTLTNFAQIQSVRDGQGNPATDTDSSPGNGFNNGEDDRDSEAVQVSPTPVFDLALNKSLAPGQSANVNPGSTVKYRITITNQGNVPATQIAITDSLPSGLVLQDAAWTATGNIATLNVPIAGPLAPSATAFVDITTQVSNSFTGSTLTNFAQIQSVRDGQGNPATDTDSSPGNGFNNGEDDRDSEAVQVSPTPVFDLALSKTLAPGQLGSVTPGSTVKYRITVTNQGNIPATQIAITDSLPSGLVLQDAAWTATGNIATLNVPIAGPLAPSATAFVDITTQVLNGFTGNALVNYAQIQGARDGQGNPVTDIDSNPGNGFNRNEDDSDSEPIVVQCPTITLTVSNDTTFCAGGSVTLRATSSVSGSTISWYTTPSGGTAFVTTASGAPLVQTPSATTVYYAEASLVNGCKSDRKPISVTVNPKPNTPTGPGTVTNPCPVPTVNLTTLAISAISTTGGVFEWRTGPSPTSALVANPTAVSTSGTYYIFEKSVSGCYSNPLAVVVNIVPCACDLVYGVSVGADQEICAGANVPVTATLSGVATSVVWSTSGTGTFANANSLTTTYSPSLADILAGNVTLTATTNDPDNQGLCVPKSDALSLIINPRPDPVFGVACDDTLVCLGKATKLIGFAPGATINWYTAPTGGTLVGTTASGGKLTITPSATTTYYAEAISAKGCISDQRTPVTVTVQPCFSDLAVLKTVLTPAPYTPGQQISYSITVTNLGIGNASTVTVDDVLPSSLTYVNSVPAGQYNPTTGVWTIGSMVASSNRNLILTAKVNANASGSITNTAIVKSPDNDPNKTFNDTSSVTIDVGCPTITPPIIACVKPNICIGGSTTITAVGCTGGTIKWSNGDTGSSIVVSPTQTTTYTATCEKGLCVSIPSNPLVINVITPVKPVLSSNVNSVCVGGSAILTAENCNGVVYWSTGATGSPIVVTPTATTTYTAYCKKLDCVSETASITIDVTSPPLPPIIVCGKMDICPGESVKFEAFECAGTVTWSNGLTGSTITVSPTVTTTYTATCTVGSCVSAPSDAHTVTVTNPQPPVIASNASSICVGGTAILTAPNCAGTVMWSNGMTGSSIVVTLNATTSFTATCSTEACESGPSNTVTVNVVVPTAPIISSNKTVICSGDSATLTATGCVGTVKWSNGMTGASINVKPNATTTYFATCQVDHCESGRSNTVTINVNTSGQPPVIATTKPNICVGETVTLTSSGCTGVVMWSNGAQGASIQVSPTTTTSYTAVCKATPSTCASGASNTVTINVNPKTPPVLTATRTSICLGESTTLTATGCTGAIQWSTGATTASITVSPTSTTTYTATCKVGDCVSQPAPITINVTSTPPPTVVCSTDSICKGGSVTLLIENCAGVAKWSTGESGAAIVVSPSVTTSYTAQCEVNGCLSASSGLYKITVVEPVKPVLAASKNPITQGETTTITATGCNGSVIWSNGALGASISVFPSTTTTYSAICIVKECESDTAKITITVNECVTKQAPTVSDKRNVCPDTTVNLRSAVVGSPAPGSTFVYRLGNTPTSAAVSNPDAVGAGVYYIFERTSTGCFSAPAKVNVTIFDCPDKDTLDLAVKKTVDKPTVEVGGEVTYTITLKNNGPVTATNITLIDILPPQLEYIAGVGYSIEGNVIKGTIPLLAAYDSLVFSCAVKVIGPGTIINTVQIANLDQIDRNPSNDISSVGVLATGGELGAALGVANLVAGTDGTFTVMYKAIVKNYSSVPMTNVQMLDTLSKAFPAPADFTVLSTSVRSGSTLVLDPSYDGKAQPRLLQENVSTLPAGAADTVNIQVKVTPNGAFGPFYSSMTAKATVVSTTLMDVSNNGFNTLPLGSTPTPVRFDQPNSFGIAKMAGDPVEIENGVFDVPYSIKVTNYGMNDLTNVQVKDDLSKTFGNGASIVPGSISVTVDPGFTVNPFYTGTGANTDLLTAASSTLPKTTTRSINIMVRVDTRAATSTAFNNTAIGTALGSGGVVLTDSSAAGEDPDPNNDLDPGNDSDPTPIVLNNIPGVAMIGVALSVEDTTGKADGSYDITYKAILKNFGSSTLTNVQLVDSLSKVFSLQTGATFKKVGTPIASNISELAINPDFDGQNDYNLLIDANSKLNPGVSDTLRFTINVSTDGRDTPYLNRVYAFAKAGDIVVTDISTNGLLPDPNGNNDPTELSEQEATPIVIPGGVELFIPEGFSPNGDGINDVFVIRNTGGQRVTLEIYNRWMTLVYKNNDYKNDWDGTVNNGLRVGSTSQGLPDGTYFYVVKLENGRQFVRFLTITR